MDWLSRLGAKIVFFEKIVQIPLSNGDILEVYGERPEGNLKQLKNMKVNEPKLEDIPNVRNFPSVFPEDLSCLLPSRKVEFRIDLIPGATPVAKLPYRLAPKEMQELSNNSKSSNRKVSYDVAPHLGEPQYCLLRRRMVCSSKGEYEVHLRLKLELLEKEKLFGRFSKCEFWLQEIAKLLTLLTQKNKKFEWGDEQEIAFLTLKDMLCDASILALPEGADDFVVYCDVSNQGKANVVADSLSRKEWMKLRRARAMSMTIHSSIKTKILEAHSEASKDVNTPTEMLRGLDKQFERKEDGRLYFVERI
ncbi:putative reverse transcriptase domain-containing protein [Tanacetum coccineum]